MGVTGERLCKCLLNKRNKTPHQHYSQEARDDNNGSSNGLALDCVRIRDRNVKPALVPGNLKLVQVQPDPVPWASPLPRRPSLSLCWAALAPTP